ncbi:MAG: hypothetical protein V3S54_09225, partial [Woeseiaceae bacterium]
IQVPRKDVLYGRVGRNGLPVGHGSHLLTLLVVVPAARLYTAQAALAEFVCGKLLVATRANRRSSFFKAHLW